MKKTTFITIITIFAVLLFGVSSFADNNNNNIAQDAVDGVRNVVGGAENAIEGAVSGIGNGISNGMSAIGNTMQDAGNNMRGGMTTDTNNGNNYDATRTTTTRTIATNNDTNTILGMGPRAWSLFILASLGIITVGLVWYYGKQNEIRYQHDDENY